MVGGGRGTFTIVCRFCKRLHFYHFTRKAANLYPTPTLCNDTAAPPTDAAMDEPPQRDRARCVLFSPHHHTPAFGCVLVSEDPAEDRVRFER